MAIGVTKPAAAQTPAAGPVEPSYLKIRDLVYRSSGIYQSEEKLYLMASSCGRRMRKIGVESAAEYLEFLTVRAERQAELRLLLNEITIGETYMFRHVPQLDAMRNTILPEMFKVKSRAGVKRIRIWSAGCSTGEEPYTLAMFLLEEAAKFPPDFTFEILATDLNDASLDAARGGIYGEYALHKTSEPLRKKYFSPYDERRLKVSDQLRAKVHFGRINLSDDGRMTLQRNTDLIFCCNVLIYFDLLSKRRVVQHFYSALNPGGYLFLGHAESLYQVDDSFRLVHFPGSTAYWKAPGAGGQP